MEVVAREARTKAGGDLTEAWFGRRGIGSRATRALLRGQQAAQRGQQQATQRAQAQAMAGIASAQIDALLGDILSPAVMLHHLRRRLSETRWGFMEQTDVPIILGDRTRRPHAHAPNSP